MVKIGEHLFKTYNLRILSLAILLVWQTLLLLYVLVLLILNLLTSSFNGLNFLVYGPICRSVMLLIHHC